MTPTDALCALHLRLTLDASSAMTGDLKSGIVPTKAGKRWLRDLARYHRLWRSLESEDHSPEDVLKDRFGYITRAEDYILEMNELLAAEPAKALSVK